MSVPMHCISCGEELLAADENTLLCESCGGPTGTLKIPTPAGTLPLAEPDKGRRFTAESDLPLLWKPGDTILDLYEVRQRIETGGMAIVYQVHHKTWNIDLAVKTPNAKQIDTQAGLDTFTREAEAWIDLGLHPHIVTCHYVRRLGQERVPRIFAEWIAGGSLLDWIAAEKLRDLPQILDTAIQFAWGLAYAHEKGLVHRDVKPENVMMTKDGTLKVTDFGLANALGKYYTPEYASPEQALGQESSFKTDIWSWALAVLHMLVGERTWRDGTIAPALLAGALQTGLSIPESLADLLRACFQDNPGDRPTSMLDVADRLLVLYERVKGKGYYREPPSAAELRAPSLNNLALSMLDLDKPDEALNIWQEALEVDPRHIESIFNRGLQQLRLGHPKVSALLEQLEKSTVSNLKPWQLDYFKIQVLLESEDPPRAHKILEPLIKKYPDVEELQLAAAEIARQVDQQPRLIRQFGGHQKKITDFDLDTSGRLLLSASRDHSMRLWDVNTGELLNDFTGHTGSIYAAALSHDGRTVVSGGEDRSVRVWGIKTGQCLHILKDHQEEVNAVAIRDDGRFIISGGGSSQDHALRLWDSVNGQLLQRFEGHITRVLDLTFSPDGAYVFSAADGSFIQVKNHPRTYDKMLLMWDAKTGQLIRAFEGHTHVVRGIGYCAEKNMLVSGSADGTIRLWDITNGKNLKTIELNTKAIIALSLSPDGERALVGDGDGQLFDVRLKTGAVFRKIYAGSGIVYQVSLSRDGLTGFASNESIIQQWNLSEQAIYQAPMAYCRIDASREQIEISSAYRNAMQLARGHFKAARYSESLSHLKQARTEEGFERDKEALELAYQLSLKLPRKNLRETWLTHTLEGHTDYISSLCISSDQKFVLSASHDKTLRLWDLITGKCLRVLQGHTWKVMSVAMSADNKRAISTSLDNSVRVWDLVTGETLRVLKGHTHDPRAVAMHPGGNYALVAGGKTGIISQYNMRLWDLNRGKALKTYKGHKWEVMSISPSYDWTQALTGSRDKTLKLWDLRTGKCMTTFTGHSAEVWTADLSLDGRRAISGEARGLTRIWHAVNIWDIQTGKKVGEYRGYKKSVLAAAWLADGNFAITAGEEGPLQLYHRESGTAKHQFEGAGEYMRCVHVTPDGRYMAAGGGYSEDGSDPAVRLWTLDWELEPVDRIEWDERARPILEGFLTKQSTIKIESRKHRSPEWDQGQFEGLLFTLGCAGFGHIRPEGVGLKLKELAAEGARQK